MGFSASCAHRLRMQGCLIRNNNTKGFDRNWEAGGAQALPEPGRGDRAVPVPGKPWQRPLVRYWQ